MAYVPTVYNIPSCSIAYTYGGAQYGSWQSISIPLPSVAYWLQFKFSGSMTIRGNPCTGILAFATDDNVTRLFVNVHVGWSYPAGGAVAIPPVGKTWAGGTLTKVRYVISQAVTSVNASASGQMIVWQQGDSAALDVEADLVPKADHIAYFDVARKVSKIRYKYVQPMSTAGAWSGTPSGSKIRRFA